MNIWILLIIILLLFGGGAIAPGIGYWGGHSAGWGPSGGIGIVVVILIVLLLLGRL